MIDTDEEEREANHFAMHLLVPTGLLLTDLAGDFSIDPTSDERIAKLARKYGVTHNLMLLRIQEEAARKPSQRRRPQ